MEKQLNLFNVQKEDSEINSQSLYKKVDDTVNTLDHQVKYSSLEEAKSVAMTCTKCALCKGRTNVVFNAGPEKAKVMIIGEGPGENEDIQGLPFVGRAGQLLDKIFESVELNRKEHLYITNVVKCRPPNNRAPFEEEVEACSEYLEAQIKYVNPKIIVLAGAIAVRGVLKIKDPKITKIRGSWIDKEITGKFPLLSKIKIMPIFHPSYLLRNEWNTKLDSPKALMWKDVKEIRRVYDLTTSS